MANLIIQENGVARATPALHGEEITIQTPCDCSAVTGVQIAGVAYPFYDAAGNPMASGSGLFAKGSLVRVLIDTVNNRSTIINHAVPKTYNKKETLTNATASLYGLSTDAVPDDVFFKLADAQNSVKNVVVTKIYSSQTWTAPKAIGQLFRVYAVGGGGGGGKAANSNYGYVGGGGGGGGFVTIQDCVIAEDTAIDVICGAGGTCPTNSATDGSAGGTTSFGSLLTAAGGNGGYGFKNDSSTSCQGGDGGAGGGAGCGDKAKGGNGSLFGGGGGSLQNGDPGTGGEYGGDGGAANKSGVVGTVFSDPLISILFDASVIKDPSPGASYSTRRGGSGGYGGGGGDTTTDGNGGGGGYCSNGGSVPAEYSTDQSGMFGSGGGGGYCSDGRPPNGGGGGGGGGLFDMGVGGDGQGSGGTFGVATNTTGKNGGVIIVYFKEEE